MQRAYDIRMAARWPHLDLIEVRLSQTAAAIVAGLLVIAVLLGAVDVPEKFFIGKRAGARPS